MKAGSGGVETLQHVQQFSNIIYRIRFYTGLKSIKVKHEGRNGGFGNSLFCNRTYAWFMIYKISTYEPIHLKLYEFKLLSLFNIKSVSQEQVQITELFAFLKCWILSLPFYHLVPLDWEKPVEIYLSHCFFHIYLSHCFFHVLSVPLHSFFHIYLSHCFFLLTILPFGPNWLRENFLSNQHFPSLCPFLLYLWQKPFPCIHLFSL